MDYATYDLDFSDEGRRRVYAFSYVLGYSRRQYTIVGRVLPFMRITLGVRST